MNESVAAPTTDLPSLISVQALSAAWGIKPATLRLWARNGTLPAIKIGRLVLFDRQAILRVLQTQNRPGA